MDQNQKVVSVTVDFETERRSDLVGKILITGVRHEHLSMLLLQHSNLTDIILATEKECVKKRKFFISYQEYDFAVSISFMPYITNKNDICVEFIYDIVEKSNKGTPSRYKEEVIKEFLQPDSEIVSVSREFVLAVERNIKEQFDDIHASCQTDTDPQYIYATGAICAASH